MHRAQLADLKDLRPVARTRIHRITASRMMGFFVVLPCIMGSGFLAQAQDEIGDNYMVTIPPPFVPLPESGQAPPPQAPGFNVIQTWSNSSYVAESPPMAGLPPVLGKIAVKTRKVEDPELPPLPESVVEAGKDATASARKDVATDDNYLGTHFIFLSATVYDHKFTLLTLRVLGANSEITAWSNLDFNHFTGASQFRVTNDTGKYCAALI